MRFGVRGKLFAISVGLILAVVLASGIYLQGELRGELEERIEAELASYASSAAVTLEAANVYDDIGAIDTIADNLSKGSNSRVTVISPDGRVLGDSDLEPAQIANIDNHLQRPEVQAALEDGRGSSQRHSSTVETDLMYVAVQYRDRAGNVGVVRAAKPLAAVDDAVGKLRFLLFAAGFVGLLVAVFMSGLASHFMSRTLKQLVDSARAIASGEDRQPIPVNTSDEFAGLAGSLNKLADDIENTVGELAAERERFKAVLESLSDGVMAVNQHREVVLMNQAALDLLGLDQIPPPTPIFELLRAPALQDLLTGNDDGQAEFEMPGTSRRVNVQRAVRSDGSVLVFQDVTEIRRLETVRRDFVANVSHELRTPVSIVRANAETLLDGAMSDPVHGTRLLEATLRNSERLSAIIADLLDLSRLEAGRYQTKPSSVRVKPVAERAVEGAERKALEREMALILDVPDELAVLADEKALEHIVLNFLENAIKYTPENGHVWITGREVEGSVRIEVRDDGPGIEPRHRARVFERFYRIDPGRSRDMGGTGLGLAIVKHLAEAMGGNVGVDPAEPHGSAFWIELPQVALRESPSSHEPDVTRA